MLNYELIITNGDQAQFPTVIEPITLKRYLDTRAATLTLTVENIDGLVVEEGDALRFKVNDDNTFFGFIFDRAIDDDTITITAYTQLRYLKNTDTKVWDSISLSEQITVIANENNLRVAELPEIDYKMKRISDNETFADMIKQSLDETLQATDVLYTMYDNFGRISLADISTLMLDVGIVEGTQGQWQLRTSIDVNTFNRIKVAVGNSSGSRTVYQVEDSESINRWGLLQKYITVDQVQNPVALGEGFLRLFNQKTKTFRIAGLPGDIRTQGGTIIPVVIPKARANNLFIVEVVTHRFEKDLHTMDVEFIGGGN